MLGSLWHRVGLGPRPRERPPQQDKLERRIDELQAAVNQIAAGLAAVLKDLAGQAFDIHIDKVCIDKVTLDQLVFNIDGIGVRDLSGSLSIGVNYGGKVIRMVQSPTPARDQPKIAPVKKPGSPAGGQPRINFYSRREGEDNDQGA